MIKPLFQQLLVVVNGTEASVRAVKYGILLAKTYRCRLHAVYIVDTATLSQLTLGKFFVEDESREYEESLSADGSRYLRYVKDLAKEKSVAVETEMRRGAVWSEVLAAADEKKADVILLGGVDYAGESSRNVLSSSYREILQNARCSVLVVREKNIDRLFKLA
ncbi:MAG: universal stress protein [Bacteroides sp.]|nr:universal stress protein [Prevotella sp.]MCM1406972.1 universal stress protein [Treponema brennaborense]MCM1470123.1 universal stress protein [Bacteroides sp.]